MNAERTALFSDAPVRKAVLTLAIPTVISQLITVVYNMANMFFIGKLNDPLQVAAATIAMPCFMLLTGFANLFGLGGSSLISRCLGTGDQEKARIARPFASGQARRSRCFTESPLSCWSRCCFRFLVPARTHGSIAVSTLSGRLASEPCRL